ncbi:unnamed protein product [Closterium sp. Yama58-4]|nr:unnamed protein product [Closterium sp. Yama58-4]
MHSRRPFERQRDGGNSGDNGGAYGVSTNVVMSCNCSPAITLDFPASPSAFPSASPSAFASVSAAWSHVSQIPPLDSTLWPSDAARFDTNGGESFPAFHCGYPAQGGAVKGTAAADVALGDWLKKAAASAAGETAPMAVGRKQRQQLLQQWFHDAPPGLLPPAFPEFNRVNRHSQVNRSSQVNTEFNAVGAFNAFNASRRVNTDNMDNTIHAVNEINAVKPVSVATGSDCSVSEPADASLRFRASESALEVESEPAASVEPLEVNACGLAIPAPEEREVQVGEVEMGVVLGRPVEDIRQQWLLLKKEIGRGQYGVIRRCVHRSTGEVAACKSIRKSAFQSAADVEAVRNEVAFMEELKGHASIIRIKQAVETHRHVHVVMELCEGGDLFDRIDSHGRLSEPSAARIFRSLMLALQHCHSHGIVHRDVKPENILLSNPANNEDIKGAAIEGADIKIKLIDFGLAVRFTPGVALSGEVGTANYMAPEVFSASYGAECDKVLEAKWGGFSRSRRWLELSSPAKHLIIRMLSADPTTRITVNEILEHEWVTACTRVY